MGLMIHSLGELPIEATRGYYIYLLDYGWKEPLGDALFENFSRMADMASRNDAVVMRGTVGSHFEDEVLSWHHVNGMPSEDILPAILVTTRHPQDFQLGLIQKTSRNRNGKEHDHPMLLIPLRKTCKTTSDVVALINQLFKNIQEKKKLGDFVILRQMKKGTGGALVDSLILQPNLSGVGIDLKVLAKKLFKRKK